MTESAADRLSAAKEALHRLTVGQQAVRVRDADGTMVEYTPAKMAHLNSYISSLEAEVGGSSAARRGPMRMVF